MLRRLQVFAHLAQVLQVEVTGLAEPLSPEKLGFPATKVVCYSQTGLSNIRIAKTLSVKPLFKHKFQICFTFRIGAGCLHFLAVAATQAEACTQKPCKNVLLQCLRSSLYVQKQIIGNTFWLSLDVTSFSAPSRSPSRSNPFAISHLPKKLSLFTTLHRSSHSLATSSYF